MQITATSWLLYDLTNSAFQLGLNGLFRAVPTIFLSLFGGALVDRYERKRVLLLAQIGLMCLAFLLGILDQTGTIEVWHIYGITFLAGLLGTVEAPARQALLPALVPRAVLPNAIALNSLLWKGSVVLGPSVAGMVIAAAGTEAAFFANGLSFGAVVIALLLIVATSPPSSNRAGFLRGVQEGLTYVQHESILVAVMAMEAASSLFGVDNAMLTIFARDVLHVGPSGLGFLQSARGLGAILGSVLLVSGLSGIRAQGRILVVSAIFYGASFASFGLSDSFPVSLVLLGCLGAADTIWGATRNTVLQLKSPDALRGRVMSIFHLTSRGLAPLAQTRTGLLVPLIGASETAFAGGLVIAGVVFLTTRRTRSLGAYRTG